MKNQNRLLDFISVKGSGEIKDFSRACKSLNIETEWWFALENLCALGHMDAETTGKGWWSCAFPHLAILPSEDECIICGARSQELLEKSEEITQIEIIRDSHGPDVWKLSFEDDKWLKNFAEETGLRYNKEPAAYTLAKALPPISKYIKSVRKEKSRFPSFEDKPQRWVPEKRDWEVEEKIKKDGLWLVHKSHSYRPVFILKEDGLKFEIGDVNGVKCYLDRNRTNLISFDSEKNTVTIKEKLKLPRLYSRILCLCSGMLPKRDDDGKLIYKKVPKGIARTVAVRIGFGSNRRSE